MKPIFDVIREGLKVLDQRRPPRVFGAEEHRFRLNPPLPESAVQAFETRHRVRLPEDYRAFLIQLGDGGAGPFYGVFRLGMMDDSTGYQRWHEGNGFIGVLSAPFPHQAPWNDLTGRPTESEDEEGYEAALDAFDRHYWRAEFVNGAIPICHEGCALRDWLVVSGPEAGHIWHDARADGAGLYPVTIGEQSRIRFLDWYMDWLDSALAQ